MASGGLYFNYLHQQFTVLFNHLCTLDATLRDTEHMIQITLYGLMVPHGDVSRRTSVKEGHCLERLRGEMPTVLKTHPS